MKVCQMPLDVALTVGRELNDVIRDHVELKMEEKPLARDFNPDLEEDQYVIEVEVYGDRLSPKAMKALGEREYDLDVSGGTFHLMLPEETVEWYTEWVEDNGGPADPPESTHHRRRSQVTGSPIGGFTTYKERESPIPHPTLE